MSELYTPVTVAPPQAADAVGMGLGLADSIYNRLLKEHIIQLGSEARNDSVNATCAQMLLLAAEDPERDIYLYINSPGGSMTVGMTIYDTMQYVQPDVAAVATGLATFMRQYLLSASAKGKCHPTPHVCMLMYQLSGGTGGSAADTRINIGLIIKMKQGFTEITATNTGRMVEEIIADPDRDHWSSVQETLEYGFVSRIVHFSREIGRQNGDN